MRHELTFEDKVTRLVARAIEGGGTLDPLTGQDVRSGFVVALAPEGPGQTLRVPRNGLRAYELEESAAWLLVTARNLGVGAGVWFDDGAGEWVFDLVEIVPTLEHALTLGAERQQIAVYDIAGQSTVNVQETV